MSGAPRPIAIGAMRLSTAEDRDDERAGQVLDAALAAGVTWIDTADVYARDEHDVGHNERLVAAAVARHKSAGRTAVVSDPGPAVTVITKGGLVREGKRWASNARAQHLAAAARASRERLGGAPVELYLLHAPDPQVPLATSVRALAKLVEDGVARRVGLSNIGRVQLDDALATTEIAAVEVELGPHEIDPILGGLIARCAERDIPVLAYRPLGGPDRTRRWAKDRALRPIAERHGATPAEVLLAWLRGLSPVIVPLPGPTTVASVLSVARAAALVLDEEARAALNSRFLGASAARLTSASGSTERTFGPAERTFGAAPREFNWRRDLEPPALDEGFATVERIAFSRARPQGGRPSLIVDLDDVVRVGRPTRAAEVTLVPGAAAALHAWADAGWAIAATSWQPASADLAAVDARTAELLGIGNSRTGPEPLPTAEPFRIVTCPHPAGPPVCWCRKPMPGLGLLLARRHGLDLARSVHIGRGAADRGFAERLGMRFADPAALHQPPPALP